ncbi:protein daughter of sevenless isoform X2 [Drosophila grimshawi]|uniref:protein daughter of sevenless isoform X2 n=1 Tax=Drosophila grimshawi TaxID=7222 RepID=UPI000C86EFF7|nr:protein daughter of sevenless isoform X2 [Drosophila grimshawi]
MDSTFHEGWLIKSPPSKRIWRARWRRRWFTLKQGEIPEQFCLEYYTDQYCRKLKGVIDLDQCEQVDCGLRLENRKQKFQYMFDIKTPKRTYYLAAETEASMRDWVNCICQVCHLHDTKQSNELPLGATATSTAAAAAAAADDNRSAQQHTSSSGALSNSTQNTTTTSLHSSAGTTASSLLRRPVVIDQQPQSSTNNNSDSVYVNTDYNNRETLLCDAHFDQQQLLLAAQQQPPPSPATALYLNQSALIQAQAQAAVAEQQQQQQQQQQQAQAQAAAARLAINANGVVRKLPEHLVLTQQTLSEAMAQQQQHGSVQASPALSTASGPYIPISECFTGSPKLLLDSHASAAGALNNLDPKFYDTPRSHNNIGLNLTNDQSYSPKITNCSLQQMANASSKQRSQRSDSDSESVFTDDDEWTHPLPLRENVDRSTRPSDSSIENESFVLTYSQRFSKMPEDGVALATTAVDKHSKQPGTISATAADGAGEHYTLERLAKVLKNKNNLILDFKDNEKLPRDLPQLSDTENTSPAIVASARHANSSLIEESYDIPRSHQLPYCNVGQLLNERPVTSPHNTNPIAASTPNLMADACASALPNLCQNAPHPTPAASSPTSARTLPRQHCYTNAAPTRMEGTVFRYDFIEQADCPPVNRKLKPKVGHLPPEATHKSSVEDRPPEEFPAKPPVGAMEQVISKLYNTKLQSCGPPSVDRKCKPNAYKMGSSATMSPATRRSSGAPLSMVLPHETDVHSPAAAGYFHETRTLPRQQHRQHPNSPGSQSVQHQRTASAAAAMTSPTPLVAASVAAAHKQNPNAMQQLPEHKLQYFDLDVTNKPPMLNRQSMSVGNLYSQGGGGLSSVRLGATDAASVRVPVQSSVVYNFVDFVKTEAFKRVREERNKESSESGGNK